MKVGQWLRRVVYRVPGAQSWWIGFNRMIGREGRSRFTGWGISTESLPPWWNGQGDAIAKDFLKAHADVVARVEADQFRLSQFSEVQDKTRRLGELMWRHYIVFWSVRYACRTTASPVKNLVECGVCDGLTAHFAMTAARGDAPFRAFLFDAWESMKGEQLLPSEQGAAGAYSYLSVENTKRNLAGFDGSAVFVKGTIPESFEAGAALPADVVWLHIDLNASRPTAAALEVMFDRMPAGGLALFDDYGWDGFADTKAVIDAFLARRRGVLLPMPTGQAILFKY